MKTFGYRYFVSLLAGISISMVSMAQHQEVQKDFELFADGIFETIMDEKNIAGATFSVVINGETIINKGYGYANVEQELTVDPDKTLFRIGSISKVFVWIAAMQMVEQGKLELDRDVNDYLTAFKIPASYNEPITLRSLMTHTPGFEDKLYQLFVHEADGMIPLEQLLKEQMPKRVRPPMQQASYSNHGTGIAQYLVELASGMPFIEYAEKHLFSPLGMKNTTLRQPLPDNMLENLSHGYVFVNGRYVEKPFELVPLQGVGGVSTTATDMARLMKALLNNTCLDVYCLLDSTTYATMIAPAFYHAKGVNPATLGFMDMSRNGRRAFGHGGNTFLFHSRMTIIPEEKTAYFYSFNSENGAMPSSKVSELLFDRFFPDERPLQPTIELDESYLNRFAGSYRINRFPYTEFFKVLALMNTAKIGVEEGKLHITAMGETKWYLPLDSLSFREKNSNEIIVFSLNSKGKVENLFVGDIAIMALNKNRGKWSPTLHLIILALLLFTILYVIVYWLWLYLVRRRYNKAESGREPLPFAAKLFAWLTAVCYLLFFIFFLAGAPPGTDLVFGVTGGIRTALVFPILAIPFTLAMTWQAIRLIDMKNVRISSRLFYWFLLAVFVASIWFFNFWKLLGWHY